MNKAFVREPDVNERAYCPGCGTLGMPVKSGPMDTHIRPESRAKLGELAWHCDFERCDVAYFNMFEAIVTLDELKRSIYPHDLDAPLCACFGFTYDDVEADAQEEVPMRIRKLLERSKSPEAHCDTLAVNGQCCMREVQRLYMKLRS